MAGYGSNEEFQDWLDSQGLSIPDDAPSLDVLRQIGSDYVDAAYEYMLKCSHRTDPFNQERVWPRTGHYFNGQPVPDNLIPKAWVLASYRAAWLEANNPGWATNPSTPGRITKREKVDVIEREFFSAEEAGGGASAAPGFPTDAVINGLVVPWLCADVRDFNSLFLVI